MIQAKPGIEPRDPASARVSRELAVVRCSRCSKIICKRTSNALRAGEVVEIKCGCNELNYLMGGIDG